MVAMNLNTGTYFLTPTAVSQTITLGNNDANQSSVIISNATTKEIFVYSSPLAGTAVFPSGSTPTAGTVVLSGAIVTFTKNPGEGFLNVIQGVAGTGNAYFKIGPGE